MAFPSQWLDELLSKNDIAEVVSSYVELKPKGRKLWGLCPLHGEKTPSFSVSPDKQMFYCFGCHAGGTVIQFIMSMEKLTYPEAIRYLADRAHMEMPEERNDQELMRQRAYRQRLQDANQKAARFYCETFLGENGEQGREYAQKRGLSRDIILRFGIGYAAPGWDNLKNALTEAGFSERELLDSGLLVKNPEKGSVYDAYRNRLIFPILGVGGQVLGFGGRVLDDSKPKYINTGDTPIYNKRNNLYGLYLQKTAKLTDLIMVEGYMDVIGLYKAGVTNAVASLGTALTVQQARLLKRYVETVYIAYDGDAAGQNATIRGLDILSGEGLSVRVIVFPDDLDPDEYVQIYGKAGFDALKENALTLNAFKLDAMAKGMDFSDENQREGYAVKACAYVAKLQPVEQERYYKRIAERTGYDLASLREQGNRGALFSTETVKFTRGSVRRRSEREENARELLERTLITCALKDREVFLALKEAGAMALLREETYSSLAKAMGEPGFSFPAYVAGQPPEEAERLSAVLRDDQNITEPLKTALDCQKRLENLDREDTLFELQGKLKQGNLTQEERAALLNKITDLIRAKK